MYSYRGHRSFVPTCYTSQTNMKGGRADSTTASPLQKMESSSPQLYLKAKMLRIPSMRPNGKYDEMERLFQFFDENGDGKISPAELQSCMRALGEELSLEEAEALMESSDTDGDGLLGFDDFVKLVGVEREEEKGRHLREAFRVYEMEGEGCITPKSLKRTLSRLGQRKTIDECTVMIRRFDINGDGVLSFDEFKVMMH